MTRAQRKLRGRSHHKKRAGKPVVETIGAPEMPPHIRGDEIAAQAWERLRRDLTAMKVLTKRDWAALEVLCTAYSLYVNATEIIHKRGVLLMRGRGTKTRYAANPAISVARNAWKDVVRISTEFGLTPVSRTRVSQVEDEDLDTDGKKQVKAKQTAEDWILRGSKGASGAKVVGTIGAR